MADAARPAAAHLSGGQQQRVAIGVGAHRRTRGCWCSTSRPRRSTRPRPRRCSPLLPAAGARPRAHRAAGRAPARAGGAVRRPHRAACPAAARPVVVGRPGRGHGDRAGRAAGGRAGPAGRLVAAAAVGARRPPARPAPLRDRLARRARRRRRPRADRPGAGSAAGRATSCVAVRYGGTVGAARRRPRRRAGEVVALMGRNGAGKSTLLTALVGLRAPAAGHGDRRRAPTRTRWRPASWCATSGWCRRSPATCCTPTRSRAECAEADRDAGVGAGHTADAARPARARHRPGRHHPRDLSEGQRLALALAVVLAGRPPLRAARRADPRPRLRRQGRAGG